MPMLLSPSVFIIDLKQSLGKTIRRITIDPKGEVRRARKFTERFIGPYRVSEIINRNALRESGISLPRRKISIKDKSTTQSSLICSINVSSR